MKIQCNVCGSAEAAVLCCADEATLCWVCDQKVHAANKLASKHQRVPLSTSSSSQMQPKCDICQETVGYFFCLEDRALLCRKCDVAIHTVNSLVSMHQRFLLTGVKVGLEPTEPVPSSSSSAKTDNTEKISEVEPRAIPKIATPLTSSSQYCSKSIPVKASVGEDFSSPKLPFDGGSSAGTNAQWQLDEFVGLGDFSQNCNFMVNSSSKAAENELEGDEHKGALTETFWAVPQITSLTTACELNWPKTYQNPSISPVFVPDISSWPMQNRAYTHQSHITSSKRKRHV